MITSPLFGLCWLPNNSVFTGINSVQSNNKLFGRFVWNQQCFLTIGQGQTVTPYVGFWNSVAIFQPSSHPFNMETRYNLYTYIYKKNFAFQLRYCTSGNFS